MAHKNLIHELKIGNEFFVDVFWIAKNYDYTEFHVRRLARQGTLKAEKKGFRWWFNKDQLNDLQKITHKVDYPKAYANLEGI